MKRKDCGLWAVTAWILSANFMAGNHSEMISVRRFCCFRFPRYHAQSQPCETNIQYLVGCVTIYIKTKAISSNWQIHHKNENDIHTHKQCAVLHATAKIGRAAQTNESTANKNHEKKIGKRFM